VKTCGCCGGIVLATPQAEYNRPGLPAIEYRVGTHSTFFESMVARLSSLYIDVAADGTGAISRVYPLKQLTTRQLSDPSIALLDAWAVVADVLTFYQERIANEGYLLTATERLSVLELARLIGYKLRPGVSASVFLAFTVTSGFRGEIPAGTRAQSVPNAGETAQYFETAAKLQARDDWNNLKPRLVRPQVISPPPDLHLGIDNHLGTNADILDSVYFQTVGTNLKAGDPLLLVLSEDAGQQFLRFAERVDAQADQNRTLVALREKPPAASGPVAALVAAFLRRFIDDAELQFPGSDLAAQAAVLLHGILDQAKIGPAEAAMATSSVIPQIQQLHEISVTRQFTRVEVWLTHLLELLRELDRLLRALAGHGKHPVLATPSFAVSSLERLGTLLPALTAAPSVQPANSARLVRTVTSSFASHSDTAPRLLAVLKPAAASFIYPAWGNVQPVHIAQAIYAPRVKATLFASNFAGASKYNRTTGVTSFTPATLANTWLDILNQGFTTVPPPSLSQIALDSVYDKITAGSWVAVDQPIFDASAQVTSRHLSYHKVVDVRTSSLDTNSGYTAKVTVLTLHSPWLRADTAQAFTFLTQQPLLLRTTIVYAQSEALDLAEEPLDRDVEGGSIELDGLYDGLEPGRWVIVSGERTDIPQVTGVQASELVMISEVTQGAGKELCVPFLPGIVPFDSLYYVSDEDAAGDRLVVGTPSTGFLQSLQQIPLPSTANQQFCEPIQLCPGVYADAYVPSADERLGKFSAFDGLLIDPTGTPPAPFPGGIIPTSRTDIFAWRIRRLTSGSETIHTTIQLANSLAYKYDSAKVSLYANVTNATHGQTIGEILGDGDASLAFQKFALHQKPLTYLSAPTPSGAESTLTVRVNEIEWHEEDDLFGLTPTDRDYITQTDDADQTIVVFGNGERGARVPTGKANVKATYRYGIGKAGNVKGGQISQLATHPLGLQGVINPIPASGGADRDSLERARENAPLAVMALDRLVSVRDYADFARTYAGIGKASAVLLSDGRRQLVHLTIAGVDDIPIDANSDLYRNLLLSLQDFGDPFQPVAVCMRKVRLLVISAGVQLRPDYAWESVQPQIVAAVQAGFAFETRSLSQPAFLAEAVAMMQAVRGVSYLDVQIFDSVPEDITVKQLTILASTLRLNPYVNAELAHVDPAADPSADSCTRIQPAELVYLTPDIPATLILTQIGG
jgi:hypothetical protein